jgi:hypothetical protein
LLVGEDDAPEAEQDGRYGRVGDFGHQPEEAGLEDAGEQPDEQPADHGRSWPPNALDHGDHEPHHASQRRPRGGLRVSGAEGEEGAPEACEHPSQREGDQDGPSVGDPDR